MPATEIFLWLAVELKALCHQLNNAPIGGRIEQFDMPQLTKKDLHYTYEWTTSTGDNPKLIHDDAHHLSRNEGYEMLLFLNKLGIAPDGTEFLYGSGNDLSIDARIRIEWMLKEHLKSTSPGRGTVLKWINDKWNTLATDFKPLKPKAK
ncbi:hypothetical protein [Pseudomonas putida]|uniref:hypothetical protein n=1 Tax=Pseudomonas putida TaxID=303 RepID=UPI0035709928